MSRESRVHVNSDFLSLDTALDGWIHRPAARALSRALEPYPVRPNHVTLLSLVPAVGAAILFSRGQWLWGLGGLAAFWAWAVLDHADGELARAKRLTSEFGKKLDDACDTLASGAMMTGIFYGLVASARAHRPAFWWALFIGAVALNETAHHLVLGKKRALRASAVERGSADAAVVRSQKLLDHFSGREPFYVLIFLFSAATAAAPVWPQIILDVLVAGTWVFALGGFWTWLVLSKQLSRSAPLKSAPAKERAS